eukprot:SAG11_NODE_9347_length_920_cov_0.894032_1_plen_254_part_01
MLCTSTAAVRRDSDRSVSGPSTSGCQTVSIERWVVARAWRLALAMGRGCSPPSPIASSLCIGSWLRPKPSARQTPRLKSRPPQIRGASAIDGSPPQQPSATHQSNSNPAIITPVCARSIYSGEVGRAGSGTPVPLPALAISHADCDVAAAIAPPTPSSTSSCSPGSDGGFVCRLPRWLHRPPAVGWAGRPAPTSCIRIHSAVATSGSGVGGSGNPGAGYLRLSVRPALPSAASWVEGLGLPAARASAGGGATLL